MPDPSDHPGTLLPPHWWYNVFTVTPQMWLPMAVDITARNEAGNPASFSWRFYRGGSNLEPGYETGKSVDGSARVGLLTWWAGAGYYTVWIDPDVALTYTVRREWLFGGPA